LEKPLPKGIFWWVPNWWLPAGLEKGELVVPSFVVVVKRKGLWFRGIYVG